MTMQPDDANHHRKHELHHGHVETILHNRVPEVTLVFWIIKVMSTTTGETFADYLNETVGLGLPNTTYIMMSLWFVALAAQFYTERYNAFIYWTLVVIVSIFGTLVTDCLTDELNVELWISTLIFSILLIATFSAWYYKEGTLNFHTIFTRRREAFYWIAILCTFALGTAGGDLITEGLGLGYWVGVVLFGGVIGLITAAWYFLYADGVLCFWLAYILTRPLGASIGDLLSQNRSDGGLGLGTTGISMAFLAVIVALTTYLYFKVKRERKEVEAGMIEASKDVDKTEVVGAGMIETSGVGSEVESEEP